MPRIRAQRRRRRGSALVESALVATVFLLLLVGIMEFGRLGFAYNSVSFAAQRAARFAAVRGSGSGHAAVAADIESAAKDYAGALDSSQLVVATTWLPNNNPGSTVEVKVTYTFSTVLTPPRVVSPDHRAAYYRPMTAGAEVASATRFQATHRAKKTLARRSSRSAGSAMHNKPSHPASFISATPPPVGPRSESDRSPADSLRRSLR